MFIECSLNVHRMFTECIETYVELQALELAADVTECSLNVH
jgi:hypothetical protein